MGDVASLLLKVLGDHDDAEDSLDALARGLRRLDSTTATAQADVDTSQGDDHVARLQRALRDLDGTSAQARIDLQTAAVDRQIAQVKQTLANYAERPVSATLDVKIGRAVAKLQRLEAQRDKLTATPAVAEVDVRIDREGVGDLERLASGLRGLTQSAAKITIAGLAAQAVGALGGAVTALGGALVAGGAGAAGAYATGLTAVAQASVIARVGLAGVQRAAKDLTEAFEKPGPSVERLKAVLDEATPTLLRLRNVAQGSILRGLTDAARSASPVLGLLEPVVRATAEALAALARQAGALVGSASFGRDLQAVGLRNASIIKTVGGAAIDVADALRHVVVAAGPLTSFLSDLVAGWAATARDSAAAARESGHLAAVFETARQVLVRLFGIAGSVGKILFGVGKAGKQLGLDVLTGIDQALAALARLTNSARGQTGLRDYFDSLRPTINELGLLIRDVAKSFATLGAQPGLTQLLRTLRTQLLPVLTSVIGSTTESFGPVLIEAAANVARLVGAFAGTTGPLNQFVRLIGAAAGVLATLLEDAPLLQTALVGAAGAAAVLKGALLFGKVTGITALVSAFQALKAAEDGSTAAAVRNRAAQLANAAAQSVARAATLATAAAQRVLNVAFLTNPITLVVAAVIAAAVLLITQWDKVKDALGAVWDFLKNTASSAFELVKKAAETGLLGPIGLIITRWEEVRRALSRAYDAIKDAASSAFTALRNIVTGALNAIVGAITGTASSAGAAGRRLFDAVKDGIRDAATGIGGFVRDLALHGVNAVRNLADEAAGAGGALFRGVLTGINAAIDAIGGFGSWLRDKALAGVTAVRNLADDALAAGRAAFRAVLSGAAEGLSGIGGFIKERVENGLSAVRNLAGEFLSAGRALMESLGRGIVAAGQAVLNKIKGIAKKARDLLPGSEPRDRTSPLRGLGGAGAAIVENLAAGITVEPLRDALRTQLRAAVEPILAPSFAQPAFAMPAAAGPSSSFGDTYHVQRTYQVNAPATPAGDIDARLLAVQLDTLMRDEGALR